MRRIVVMMAAAVLALSACADPAQTPAPPAATPSVPPATPLPIPVGFSGSWAIEHAGETIVVDESQPLDFLSALREGRVIVWRLATTEGRISAITVSAGLRYRCTAGAGGEQAMSFGALNTYAEDGRSARAALNAADSYAQAAAFCARNGGEVAAITGTVTGTAGLLRGTSIATNLRAG